MKNFLKLFGIVLVTATVLLLSSCEDIVKKGGTIYVTNNYKLLGEGMPNSVIIVKGVNFENALNDLKDGKGTPIRYGETKEFHFDEDNSYTVTALLPLGFFKICVLTLGSTDRVTIE